MMQRALSFIVALGLAGLGLLPVSVCAIAHSQLGDCGTPQTKTDCERMGMYHADRPGVKGLAGSKECCVVSEAPAPEARTWAGSFAVAAPPAFVFSLVVTTQPVQSAWLPEIPTNSSPPPLQTLLCIFLI